MSKEPNRNTANTETDALAGEAWRTPSPDEIVAVPGVIRVLDAGVPWIRSFEELAWAWEKVRDTAQAIADNGLPSDFDSLDEVERAVFGSYNAARWTLTQIPRTPMGGRHEAVTGGSIRRELDRATVKMIVREEGWDYACGVATWLMWITGAKMDLVLAGEPDPHA